jgi:hypothetical protein
VTSANVAAIIETMEALGHTPEDILAVVKAASVSNDPVRTARQARNARYYENRKNKGASEKRLNKTPELDTPSPSAPPSSSPPTPPLLTTPTPTPSPELGPKRVRTTYPEDFEKFWEACSAWRGHSGKKEAADQWRKLSSEDRKAAMAGVPGYSAALRVPNAPTALHVCRFLKYRRFELYAGSVLPFAAGADPPRPPMTDAEKRAAALKFDEDFRAGKYG